MGEGLVVVRAFGGHAVGDVITDAATAKAILGSEHARCVVRVSVPAAPGGKEG